MQISPKILNIPPYISTTWDHITSLKTAIDGDTYILCITLKTGESIKVPRLDQPTIKAIFKAHAEAVERPIEGTAEGMTKLPIPFTFSIPVSKREGPFPSPFPSLGGALCHNPEQSGLPNIPLEILNNIAMIAKALGLDDATALADPEENCNCVHCQLTRAFKKATGSLSKEIPVSEEELRFRDWEISQSAEKLYEVTNPLDPNEKYSVFLGDPLGCTCGQKNCEHIKAVLKS